MAGSSGHVRECLHEHLLRQIGRILRVGQADVQVGVDRVPRELGLIVGLVPHDAGEHAIVRYAGDRRGSGERSPSGAPVVRDLEPLCVQYVAFLPFSAACSPPFRVGCAAPWAHPTA